MTNKHVDTVSKERRRQVYYATLLQHHDVRPDLITDKLCNCFASITAMFFPLAIVMYKG